MYSVKRDLGNLPISAVDPESIYSKRDFPGTAILGFVLFEGTIGHLDPRTEHLRVRHYNSRHVSEPRSRGDHRGGGRGLCGCGELLKRES